jgi:poly-gamma-glutamate capsule biosynthesis protein CapA/YwtB (metallophosphatase superfamily)
MRPSPPAVFAIASAFCLLGGIGLAVLLALPATSASALPHTTTATKAARLPAKALARFTLVAGGDVALAGDPDEATLAAVRPFFRRADLAIANLEGTLAVAGSAKCLARSSGCFAFRASPGWAAVLRRAGLSALNVANNHALDYGPEAQQETLAALRSAGLAHDGLPGEITFVRAGTVRVALIGCAPYSWAQSLLDIPGTQALVRAAARRAQVVIVYMHAGAEGTDAVHVSDRDEAYLGEPRGNPVAFAHAMIDAGADLVFASGPHVLRAMEWYENRLIAYSLGNLAGTHTLATDGVLSDSALLRVTLDARGRLAAGSLVPLRLDAAGTPAVDPQRDSLRLVDSLSRQDFPTSAVRVTATGRLTPPERP